MSPRKFIFVLLLPLLTFGCEDRDEDRPLSYLRPLPVAFSEYSRNIQWKPEDINVPDALLTSGNIRCVRYSGEAAWYEVYVRDDQLLYVRRKVFVMPPLFGAASAATATHVTVVMDLQNATGREEFSRAFDQWLAEAVTGFFEGDAVDSHHVEGDLLVLVRTEGKDLIVEYARPDTMRAIKKFVHHP